MLAKRYTGCIYLATNTANGAGYIGKTISELWLRKAGHACQAKHRTHISAFHSAIRKYGAEAFRWQKLFESDDEDCLFVAEKQLIADYRKASLRLYNIGEGGEGQSIPCTPERRAKVSAAMKGRTLTPEHVAKMQNGRKKRGHKHSQETIEKIRAAKLGKSSSKWTEERRAKVRATWTAKHAEGYRVSPEARAKMSEAQRRRHAR